MADNGTPTSFSLPGDVVDALRKLGNETGENMGDMLRRGALMVLGICPTCGRKWQPDGHEAPDA